MGGETWGTVKNAAFILRCRNRGNSTESGIFIMKSKLNYNDMTMEDHFYWSNVLFSPCKRYNVV